MEVEPKYVDNRFAAKILGTIWAFLFCGTYIIMLYNAKELNHVATIFHVCIIFTTVLYISAISSLYQWCAQELFVLYNSVIFFSLYWIGSLFFKYAISHINQYIAIAWEFIGLVFLFGYGAGVGAILSIPFKLIQMFYWEVDFYEKDYKTVSKIDRFELDLEMKNETELKALLKMYSDNDEYEKCTKIRAVLQRKFGT
jgi:hypothetical protein